ncbi:hypothetical protein LDENG_00249430, partial [Lucifuga dentata]
IHPSIHPFSAAYLGSGSGGSRLSSLAHTFLSPARSSNPSWGTPRHSQISRYIIIPPVCPGSSIGPLPSWTCLEDLPRETTREHPY